MLRINQQSDAQAAKSYYGSPAEYYGASEQEMIGEWFGQGADRLGLDGSAILQHQFDRLCDNRHPLTGEQLIARTRKGRRVGYDFNFHVCKSLSILYAITGDQAILDALRLAVRETMRAMEAGVKVRVRKRGQFNERTVANLIAAEFIHFTARPVKGVIDPHLHIHAFVPNACWDHVEKMWKAIDVASIKADAPQWQEMFQRFLADRIEKLGYAVVWHGKSWEIAGISRDMIERFSGRTVLINRTADKLGITDPKAKDQIGPRTRERKRKDATMPHLRGEWRDRLTDEDRAAIGQAALRRRHPLPDGRHEGETGPAWRQAAGGRDIVARLRAQARTAEPELDAWERERRDFIRQRQRRAAQAGPARAPSPGRGR
jgi:conjugative relaxase-like TrwC/TraI family protein